MIRSRVMLRGGALLSALVVAGCVGGRGPIPADGGAAFDLTTLLDLASTSPKSGCGQQLGDTPVTFCETFDAPAGTGNRAGDLDGNVWSVARLGDTNIGGPANTWNPTLIDDCDGAVPRVDAPKDVLICDGQLREASNDNTADVFGDGKLTVLSMYPTQPFDFAGRTGTVSFDVSNDASGGRVWPEMWIADAPVPVPSCFQGMRETIPANGLGLRFDDTPGRGNPGDCPSQDNLAANRFTVGSASAVRGYSVDDTSVAPSQIQLQVLDCVVASVGPGQMNRIEVRISQSQIDVYATDAGVVPTKATLKHIATITGANLSFTRGYISLEDVHHNGDGTDPTVPSLREHTFAWDNLAFDGPFTYRDFSFDAPDNTMPWDNGSTNRGQLAGPGQTSTWSIPGLPAQPMASTATVAFNLDPGNRTNPTVLNVVVNGHAHTAPWPFLDPAGSPRPLGVLVPVTDLVAGTNTVLLGADQSAVYSNVDLVLGDVQGGVAVLPGASRAYP